MDISNRLKAVAAMVTEGNRLADIGTDHAYVPITLLLEHKIPSALAMDINKGPLEKANEHIRLYHLEQKVETRLSDGLEKLQTGESDTVLIAGMGGALMMQILEKKLSILESVQELVLAPQSEYRRFRLWLTEHGFQIMDEDMILEDGKYYPILKAVHGTMNCDELELEYGPVLLRKKHEILKKYLEHEANVKRKILSSLESSAKEGAERRRNEVMEDLAMNRKAMERIL